MSEPTIGIPLTQWNDLLTHLNDIAESLKTSQTASTKGAPDKAARVSENQPYVPVHKYVYCDGKCDQEITESANDFHQEPIRGDRYMCLECYNYDLCSSCENAKVESGSHKSFHNMVKIKTPDSYRSQTAHMATPYLASSSEFDSRTQTNDISSSTTHANTGCSSSGTQTDVIFDISDKDKDLFDFFSKLDTVEKLRSVMNKVVNYDELLIQYEALLPKTLPKAMFSTPTATTADNFPSSTPTSSKEWSFGSKPIWKI
ncbi:hypothetical protein ACO0QE_001481 [Hanseniaspora vineae]